MAIVERNYIKALLAVFITLIVAAIASLGYALVVIVQTDAIMDNILELVYMFVHICVVVLGTIFCIQALQNNKGSYIMKTYMMIQGKPIANKTARIVAIVLSSLGFIGGVYFTLVLAGVPLYSFHFPITLVLDLINSPFTVFIVGLFFIFYPVIYQKSHKED